MMRSITIDIINDKAVRLLQDMELQQLIRVRRKKPQSRTLINWSAKYKGAMQKQPLIDINNQLNDLRNAWE